MLEYFPIWVITSEVNVLRYRFHLVLIGVSKREVLRTLFGIPFSHEKSKFDHEKGILYCLHHPSA